MRVIVISGQMGSGSTTLGRLIAEKTGLGFFSVGQYFKNKSKTGKNETEKALEIFSTEEGRSKRLHENIDEMQKELAKKGNIVIDSKLGINMLKDYADKTVWIKADEKIRAERFSKRDAMNIKEAIKKLREKEKAERETWKDIYGFDYFEQEKYADIVIDTTVLTSEQVAEIVLEKI